MARNREALILLVDVGPSMHEILPDVEKLCSILMGKKLIFSKYDEVAVVAFGTEETKNELTNDIGGYEHVSVLRGIRVVDEDLVEISQQLPRGTVAGDFLDAIIVGMDMLIKVYGPSLKGKKRLCLITNAACPTKPPFEGTKDNQVGTIAVKMAAEGIKMESIIVRGRLSGNSEQEIMDENDRLLKVFSSKGSAKTQYVENRTSLLGALRTRKIAPVTVFRGDLEISPKMKIKVWVYKKTSEEKFPTLKKYSNKAPPTDRHAVHEVKIDTEYKTVGESSKVVAPEDRVKGYLYGPEVIPISSAEWDAVKFKPDKGVKLLGFTDASNVMRHYYMKDVYIFIAEPGRKDAALAVSAIARAMKEANKVAILRCVWRQRQEKVVVGVLTPNVSVDEKIADSFYFNVLPFAEDVREYRFPSFGNLPASLQPNEQQQQATDNFVKMLDLSPPAGEEALRPDVTPNPVLLRYYHHLELKSKSPDAAVPPVDESLKIIMEPDHVLLSENKSIVDAFQRSFELKENFKFKKSIKRFLREKPSGSDDEKDFGYENKSLIDKIGDETPVQDFEAMMSRRDSPEWVDKAIAEMKSKILKLMLDEGNRSLKTVPCLVALRKSCIQEQEPKHFNDFLRHLLNISREKGFTLFIGRLASEGITLIAKSEAADSDVTDEEARNFPLKKEVKPEE